MVIKKFIILIPLLLITSGLYAQQNPNYKSITTQIGNRDTLVTLPEKFIIPFSEILTLQNKILTPVSDYKLDQRQGIITLSKDLFSKYELDTFQIYNLRTDYDVFPYDIKEEYSNFEIITELDTITGDSVMIATQNKDFMGSLFEGTDLQKSGSLFRGVTLGSNRDLSLNSGFRLQLNGKLTDDLEINAALTDETTPIQPEGNTQKLQELDNVFIELKGQDFTGTIGDIKIDFVNTQFTNFSRKIQGAKGFGSYGNGLGDLMLAGAVQRGKYNTNAFNGTDGIQGPYYLIGRDNELNILVLSGTESVYLDGIQMLRGEQADYTIDYGIGTITFTNNRIITVASRIIVDFEYTDREYTRTLISGANNLNLLSNKLKIGFSYVNEDDNEDKPIDFSLTETDKEILSQAGDNRLNAVVSGVQFVGRDSAGIGLGLYVKSDTLINTETIVYYKYLPNDSNALYQVAFSFVGQAKGNYIQNSSLQYTFNGISQGSFDTVVFIPLPNSYQIADINLNYESSPQREFTMNLESAFSTFDANKFSEKDDNNNVGVALFGTIGLSKQNFNFLGTKINALELKLKSKIVNKLFVPLERYNPVEFYRQYDIQDSNKLTEDLREASLFIAPVNFVKFNAQFGQLLRGDGFNSLRTSGEFVMSDDTKKIPDLFYNVEYITTDNSYINTNSVWLRQTGSAGYKKYLGDFSFDSPNLELKLDFHQENRKNIVPGQLGDSLLTGSFSFYEVIPNFTINNLLDLNFYTAFKFRLDNQPINGIIQEESETFTQTYGLRYGGVQWFSTFLELSFRKKEYTDEFISDINTNNNSLLVNWQTRLDPLDGFFLTDLLYNTSSEREAKTERVFVEVRVGEGNYIYIGDLNANGLKEENEFQLTNFDDGNYIRINQPTAELFPVTVLNTSARITLKPARYFNISGNDFLSEVIRNFTTESYVRIEENSKNPDTDDIYFLNFSTFQNDSNTLFGTNIFQQDINFFEYNTAYSLKLRYIQQQTMNQFVGGNERFFGIQKLVKLKLGLTTDITTFFEYTNRVDRNDAPLNSVRNRNIKSEGISGDFSYMPIPEIESGFQLNFASALDYYPTIPTQADINTILFRIIYSFTLSGRVRAEIQRDNISINNPDAIYPYELTNGKPVGNSILWRLLFDYSISKNLQATFNYDGRAESNRNIIHTGRAEIKAFF
ncbi:MAG TPA: hypothetical protein PK294_01860 [Ignavibacteria bacterium]|nr:hypothetical protein [Ignavibacteria bacterium]